MKNVLVTLTTLGFSAALLSGCYTMQGAGKDVERTGEAIQSTARAASEALHNAISRLEAEYKIATQTCAGLPDAQREACRAQARAEYRAQRAAARAAYQREAAVGDAEDQEFSAYAAARDRCEALQDADEQRCIDTVVMHYSR
jgi:predicted small secreted protein